MKKLIAIFLSFTYAGFAFSIGVDCSYCYGKSESSVHGSGKWECNCSKHDSMNMNCCKENSVSCKSKDHKNQVLPTTIVTFSLADHTSVNSTQLIDDLSGMVLFKHFGCHHAYIQGQSSRVLLSLIHTLRI